MQSAFHRQTNRPATTTPTLDERYDFRGLNIVAPDQTMPGNKSPYLRNTRRYAKNEGDSRVPMHTRRGSQPFIRPLGEALNFENTATPTGDLEFSADKWLVKKVTAQSAGRLTQVELEIKKSVSGNAHARIEIYADSDGNPGRELGQTSILASSITDGYQLLGATLVDAPEFENAEDFWLVLRGEPGGSGSYHLKETAGTDMFTAEEDLTNLVPVEASFQFKTYFSPDGKILGFTRRNPKNKEYRTLYAVGTKLIAVDDNGVQTEVGTDEIHPNAQYVRFDQYLDKTIWVDGINKAKWWDGDAAPGVVPNAPGTPTNVIVHENRVLFVSKDDPTLINYSALLDPESYPSVNFIYMPTPQSPDHISAWAKFQGGLMVFTHKTKWNVLGSSVSTFSRREAVGTLGAISQEAIAVGKNGIYFMSNDNMIYKWNGTSDELESLEMEPEFDGIQKRSVRLELHRNELRVYYAKKSNPSKFYMALYDVKAEGDEDWFLDEGREVMGAVVWDHNDNEIIEFSSKVGQLFHGETSFSDSGKRIKFAYHLAYNDYGTGMAKDRVKKFRPLVLPAQTPYYLMVGKDVDMQDNPEMAPWEVNAGGATWGNFVWGDGTLWGEGKAYINDTAPMSGRGHYTQYRFEAETIENPVWLVGYQALIKSGRPK